MKIILLGTGGPRPDPDRNGPGVILADNETYILFDAGRCAAAQLVKAGIQPEQLTAIFITHHHFDHISDLGDLILSGWNNGRNETLDIYGPCGTEDIVHTLLNRIYARDIHFRLTESNQSKSGLRDIADILKVTDVLPGIIYNKDNWIIRTEYVEHGHGLGLSQHDWPCLGYRIEHPSKTVVISGDTVSCAGLDRLAFGADVLIQCCYLSEAEIIDSDAELISHHILASSGQAGRIARKAGVKQLILTHLRQKTKKAIDQLSADARQEFAGEVIIGEDLMVIKDQPLL